MADVLLLLCSVVFIDSSLRTGYLWAGMMGVGWICHQQNPLLPHTAFILPKAEVCVRNHVQPYIPSILEALMVPTSQGFTEVRDVFFKEVTDMNLNVINEGGIDKLGEVRPGLGSGVPQSICCVSQGGLTFLSIYRDQSLTEAYLLEEIFLPCTIILYGARWLLS